jgi:hypothetical protein
LDADKRLNDLLCMALQRLKIQLILSVTMALGLVCRAEDIRQNTGQPSRAVKSLSDSEIAGYLEGRGMGFAKTAELNGYPGPDHVLELATQLGLSPHQRATIERLKHSMKKAARLGNWLVRDERRLDLLFAEGQANDENITPLVQRIGNLEAEIRLVHLRAHIEMRRILSADQIKKYEQARGHAEN